jgi:diguanylate cyclase (GGDEF)-like protein
MSFRFRIIAGVVLIQTVLLAILIWNGLHALLVSNEEEFFKRSEITVRLFSSATKTAILATDLGTLESAAHELLDNPNVVYVRIYGHDKLLLEKGAPEVLVRRFVRDRSLDTVHDKVFDEASDVNVAGQNYGRVEIGFSVESLSEIVDRTRNRFLLLAAANLVLIVIFATLLGVALTRKLQALREATARISQGEFGYQVRMSGRDELAKTAGAFNAMSLQLKRLNEERGKAEAEMLALNEDLERRVQLRTHELTDLTHELEDLNKELEFQALHDELTRLPNRTLFNDRLRQAVNAAARDRRAFALIAFDLDRFKEINDTRGHYAGDVVLMEVARRSRRALRRSDTVARVGGDEFSILLAHIGDDEDALHLVQQIHQAICGPLSFDGHVLEISASMGIAIYGEHGDNAEELSRNADAAMYEAKRKQSGVVIYHGEIEQAEDPVAMLKIELR